MDPQRVRELLARDRERIERTLEDLRGGGSDELANYDQHPADAGSEVFEAERDQGLAERLRVELEAVERAERRLEEGTYGLSVESGEPIPDERLEAVPTAERTVEEQLRFERSG